MRKALLLLLLVSLFVGAQETKKPDVWSPLKYFVGTWKGTGKGEPGTSTLDRQYQFILRGKFLQVTHKSVYAPQEKNPKGETHDDIGFLSYDRARKAFIFRQFHVEGFVNQYKSESISADGKSIVFVSESLENIPAGYRARETYKILNENEFTETFEIAAPSKDFTVYSENHFTRQK
ncbi:MAG: heme-binding beta-barrel domain-containing protein [Pyrinomonadaceae bacterium]